MTIWAFGDSFIDSYVNNIKYQQVSDRGIKPWLVTVGEAINTEVNNFGCCGSSPDYSYKKFNDVRNDIKENDIVIFALTSLNRKWFFPEHPSRTVISSETILNKYSENQREALKQYMLHLDQEDVYYNYFKNFIENLNYLSIKLKLHTILLPCMYIEHELLKDQRHLYPNIHMPLGFLSNVNYKQYCRKFYGKTMNTVIEDGLINHLIWSNHQILSKKIIANIQTNKPINLEKDFIENVITGKTIKNVMFLRKEFSTKPIQ